jgi:hypothetical protein
MSLSGNNQGLDAINSQISNIDDLTTAVSRRLGTQLMSMNYAVNNIRTLLTSMNSVIDKVLPAFDIDPSTNEVVGVVLTSKGVKYKIVVDDESSGLEIRKLTDGGGYQTVGRFV